MAAFFAIQTDGFPMDEQGRIPFDYLLKYLCTCFLHCSFSSLPATDSQVVSLGLGLSIPFIFIALNVDRIAAWMQDIRDLFGETKSSWNTVLLIAVLVLATLVPILTSHLATGIKVAVTVFVVILLVVGGVYHTIRRLTSLAGQQMSETTSDSSSIVDD